MQIPQLDGNVTSLNSSVNSDDSSVDSNISSVNSDEQVDPVPDPAVFAVDKKGKLSLSPSMPVPEFPLIMLANLRSAFNKAHSLNKMLTELGPEVLLAVETWERPNNRLEDLITSSGYRCKSVYRTKTTGGGCAVIYNEKRQIVRELDYINVPDGVEAIWAMVSSTKPSIKFKKICVAAVYISPKSRYKKETVEHIIETIHLVRSRNDNEVSFSICGDFNKYSYEDILDAYGALHQVVTEATRKEEILDIILTDLHIEYHTPISLQPLEVDSDIRGKDSDHNVILFPPIPFF